MRLLSRR